MTEQASDISIIIPVLNESAALPANLEALLANDGIREIVIVDGGSTDGTSEYLRTLSNCTPRLLVLTSAPGRGCQMNAGAAACKSEWLLFHHADTQLPAGAIGTIRTLPAEICWGGFRHRFAPDNWKLRMVSALHNFRCRTTGVIYGDQSMFVRREFFQALDGFPDHFLEDLAFSDLALEHQPSHLLEENVLTDSRKFTQMGEFRATWHVVSIILRYQWSKQIGNEVFFRPYR